LVTAGLLRHRSGRGFLEREGLLNLLPKGVFHPGVFRDDRIQQSASRATYSTVCDQAPVAPAESAHRLQSLQPRIHSRTSLFSTTKRANGQSPVHTIASTCPTGRSQALPFGGKALQLSENMGDNKKRQNKLQKAAHVLKLMPKRKKAPAMPTPAPS